MFVPVTVKSPLIVTVEPSSVMILFVNCLLPLSHFKTLLSIKFAEFLIEYSVPPVNTNPVPAVNEAPVSVLTEEISIVFPVWVIVVAPEATNVISPETRVPPVVPLTLVTVFVSVDDTVIVEPD